MSRLQKTNKKLLKQFSMEQILEVSKNIEEFYLAEEIFGDGKQLMYIYCSNNGGLYYVRIDSKIDLDNCGSGETEEWLEALEEQYGQCPDENMWERDFLKKRENYLSLTEDEQSSYEYDDVACCETYAEYQEQFDPPQVDASNGWTWGLIANFRNGAMDSDLHDALEKERQKKLLFSLNFKKQFADKVEKGEKCRTIRAVGKRPAPVVGQTLRLYTGMRSPKCRLLREVQCTSVEILHFYSPAGIFLNGKRVFWGKELDEFAQADGFANFTEMYNFFVAEYGQGLSDKLFNLIQW